MDDSTQLRRSSRDRKVNFYTPKEISKVLKINYNRVLDLIHLGELSCIKIGRDYRISELHLLEFTNKNKFKSYWAK